VLERYVKTLLTLKYREIYPLMTRKLFYLFI
jgi:hypothetical protein